MATNLNLLLNRRQVLAAGVTAAAIPGLFSTPSRAADEALEVHGLSTFGELDLPENFERFSYVNPEAPKGGRLLLQAAASGANTNPRTFDTLHTFIFRGDGAAGMDNTFDSLMVRNFDEPSSVYGLVARKVQISTDKLTYRFLLRPEARFHDGTKLTAGDAAFTFNILKTKGHPSYKNLLGDLVSATAESPDVLTIKFSPDRSRDIHLVIAELPIFSKAYWTGRDFEKADMSEPLGSGPYKLSKYKIGRNIEFKRVENYWAKDLAVNAGLHNFDIIRYEYFRDRQIAFEAFKSAALNFREEFTSRRWHTAYNFPAVAAGKVKKVELTDGSAVPIQGWYFNTRRKQFKDRLIREAIALAFDFEWTNRNIMYSTFKRITSFFENTDMKAIGKPSRDELKLLEQWRGKIPDEVFGEPWLPPVTSSKGYDRAPLQQAYKLLEKAGCKPSGDILLLPDGSPLEFEFLFSRASFKPHTQPFQKNLRKLGIQTRFRVVDAAQYKRRIDQFDYDITVLALGGTLSPDDGLRNMYSSESAKIQGSHNRAGVSDPVIDEIIDLITKAKTRRDLTIAARVLDRVLRAGRYWIPMWYKNGSNIAYWDVFGRPSTLPQFATGAPDTWWWDEKKARVTGMQG